MSKTKKWLAAFAIALGIFATQALPALACGGLIAPDGDVHLARASTLVAWHNGIEQYMTSFTYQGNEKNVGWIVPLPAVPTKIQAGGRWTLQRLAIESHPQPKFSGVVTAAAAVPSAQVLQQVTIEALNITVIRGSGQEVLNWAASNGFAVVGDTRAHLLIYAQASPIFMAAKFDTSAAQARHQLQGDGTPILITMKTPHIWVPLEILALDGQQVQADLYFLTDEPITISDLNAVVGQSSVGSDVPGATGFKLAFQEPMNATLYHDLSTDRNMGWVQPTGWFTYMSLNASADVVTYDMGIGSDGVIHLSHFGVAPMSVVDSQQLPSWLPMLPVGTPEVAIPIALLLIAAVVTLLLVRRRKGHISQPAQPEDKELIELGRR